MVSFTLEATVKTASKTKKLPKLAPIASEKLGIRSKLTNPEKIEAPMIRSAAPKLAPELIPNTNGPASGFRNKVCINKPLKDNAPPAKIAVKALGIL